MTTGAFSQNLGKLFSELKLVTDNLSSFMQKPTEKPLKAILDREALNFYPGLPQTILHMYVKC